MRIGLSLIVTPIGFPFFGASTGAMKMVLSMEQQSSATKTWAQILFKIGFILRPPA
jgi:hypothetical protein